MATPIFGLGIIAIIVYWFLRGVHDYAKEKREERQELQALMGDRDALIDNREPSLLRRILLKPRYWFASRDALVYEMRASHDASGKSLLIRFFVPRKVIHVDIFTDGGQAVLVKSAEFYEGDELIRGESRIWYKQIGPSTHIRLYPPKTCTVDRVTVPLEDPVGDFNYKVESRISNQQCPDLALITNAINSMDPGEYQQALNYVDDYNEYANDSPYAYHVAAEANLRLGNLAEAEYFAIKAAVHGQHDAASQLYREAVSQEPNVSDNEIERLKSDLDDWDIASHHGMVVLSRDEETTFGIDGFYLIRRKELLLIRRSAAARMLRLLTFEFPSHQILLHTEACVRRDGEEIEKLSLDLFDVAESAERNVFIRTTNQYTGSWILPDLLRGDVVEWSHHLLCRELVAMDGSRPHFIERWRMCNSSTPLLEGTASYKMPEDYSARFSCSDMGHEVTDENSSQDGIKSQSYSLQRYIPTEGVGFPYVEHVCRPSVVCSSGADSWKAVAESLAKTSVGDLDYRENVPAPIMAVVESATDPASALESAFYWIRDKLKYGSFNETGERIGKENRGVEIIESGMADCKDTSYLLHLVCKHLNLKVQYLLVSSEHGKVFEDQPSDQFDHLIVRVLLDDRWHYLDAASSYSVFNAPPVPLQGMNALVLETGEIIRADIPDPSLSVVEISEEFHSIESGWLSGDFRLRATGQVARLADENWKAISLGGSGQQASAQSFLQAFMPSIIVKDHRRLSDTSNSDEMEVTGREMRCRLARMGSHEVGVLEWYNPIQSIYDWRSLPEDSCFAFRMPCTSILNISFSETLSRRIHTTSRGIPLDNALCMVSTLRDESRDSYTIRREITIKDKYVGRENADVLRLTMEHLEEAFRLAISLKGV